MPCARPCALLIFASTRGRFRYNTNQFPIQDFHLVQAIRRADGNYVTSAKRKIFADYADRQASKCPCRRDVGVYAPYTHVLACQPSCRVR